MNDRAATQAQYRVLVVDDDPDMVAFLARFPNCRHSRSRTLRLK